jgi:hypothetical protein
VPDVRDVHVVVGRAIAVPAPSVCHVSSDAVSLLDPNVTSQSLEVTFFESGRTVPNDVRPGLPGAQPVVVIQLALVTLRLTTALELAAPLIAAALASTHATHAPSASARVILRRRDDLAGMPS